MSSAYITRRGAGSVLTGEVSVTSSKVHTISVPELAGKKRWLLLALTANYSEQTLITDDGNYITLNPLPNGSSDKTYQPIFVLYYDNGALYCMFGNGQTVTTTDPDMPITITADGTINTNTNSQNTTGWCFWKGTYRYIAY